MVLEERAGDFFEMIFCKFFQKLRQNLGFNGKEQVDRTVCM